MSDDSLNAPELARIAENEGVQLITVHGRTRWDVYRIDDWRFIRRVTDVGPCLLSPTETFRRMRLWMPPSNSPVRRVS